MLSNEDDMLSEEGLEKRIREFNATGLPSQRHFFIDPPRGGFPGYEIILYPGPDYIEVTHLESKTTAFFAFHPTGPVQDSNLYVHHVDRVKEIVEEKGRRALEGFFRGCYNEVKKMVGEGVMPFDDIPLHFVYFGDPNWNATLFALGGVSPVKTAGELKGNPQAIFLSSHVGLKEYNGLAAKLLEDFDVKLPQYTNQSFLIL